jgi:hypothetical protein
MYTEAFRTVQGNYELYISFLNRRYFPPIETICKKGDRVLVEGNTIEFGNTITMDGEDSCKVGFLGERRDVKEVWRVRA